MKLYLAHFVYGDVVPECFEAVLRELRWTDKKWMGNVEYHRVSEDALISRARSRATALFLASNCDVLFMLDHDVSWATPGALWRTAAKAHAEGACVAGLYAQRAFGCGWSSRVTEEGVAWEPGADQLVAAEHLATGFLAIPRGVLNVVLGFCRTTTDPDLRVRECADQRKGGVLFHDLFRPFSVPSELRPEVYEYLSEDWAFCRRATAAGFKHWLYMQPVLTHHGRYGFALADGVAR